MRKLYSNGKSSPIIISDQDGEKIGRGFDVGHNFGTVKDLYNGKVYEVKQANCGADNCNCAVTVKEVK